VLTREEAAAYHRLRDLLREAVTNKPAWVRRALTELAKAPVVERPPEGQP